jgi:hypothetical protein
VLALHGITLISLNQQLFKVTFEGRRSEIHRAQTLPGQERDSSRNEDAMGQRFLDCSRPTVRPSRKIGVNRSEGKEIGLLRSE